MIYKVVLFICENCFSGKEFVSYWATNSTEEELREHLLKRYKGYHTCIIKSVTPISFAEWINTTDKTFIELED